MPIPCCLAHSKEQGSEKFPRSRSFRFPSDFLLGVAAAAYQIEGAWNVDGKGDVELLQALGVKAYRFSIAWTRLLPEGRGRVNPAGIAFYKDLLRRLRKAGIQAAVTLYHWDLPQKLEEEGGWANRAIVDDFDAYARLCFSEFGADVSHWITFNEPFGHRPCWPLDGEDAPGQNRFEYGP